MNVPGGTRVWQFSKSRFATGSVTLGGSLYLVPEGADAGLGPHAGLQLALGGEVFTVDLGLQTGAELFARELVTRLPQRLQVSVNLRVGLWAVGLHLRGGFDVMPGHSFVGRGEAVLSVGWFGLVK